MAPVGRSRDERDGRNLGAGKGSRTAMAQIIVALDLDSGPEALKMVRELGDAQSWYKVGLELYTREGPGIVRELKELGKSVFLDLKLHDIPATVGKAAAAAADLGVGMLTVHVAGGKAMATAAKEAAGDELLLLGVTVLTSLSLEDIETVRGREISSVRNEVQRLAELAIDWNMGGVVSSALEAAWIRGRSDDELAIVTPGIRGPDEASDDQTRVATPAQAVEAGADYLVVGRPVVKADNPSARLASIRQEMASVSA